MTAPQAQLVLEHLPIARRIAAMFLARRRLPMTVELGDLESAGVIGLIDAAQRFDPDRGYRFATLAGHRVRGAMLDAMREAALLSRQHLADIRAAEAPPVTRVLGREAERKLEAVRAADAEIPDPLFARRVLRLLRRLPVTEARILIWRHWGGLTLAQCADLLTLSPSRVRQLEEQACLRLRRMLEAPTHRRAA